MGRIGRIGKRGAAGTRLTGIRAPRSVSFPFMSMREKLDQLGQRRAESELGGGAARLKAQHDKGKLSARERLDALLDEGSFIEFDRATQVFKDFYSCDSDVAVKGIAQASEHQMNRTLYRKKPSLLPPSTVMTHPVVRLLRASLASQQIASAQSFGVTTVPSSDRFA